MLKHEYDNIEKKPGYHIRVPFEWTQWNVAPSEDSIVKQQNSLRGKMSGHKISHLHIKAEHKIERSKLETFARIASFENYKIVIWNYRKNILHYLLYC